MTISIDPMLAKAVDAVPEPDSVAGGLLYEPKWDGFRGIVSWDGSEVEIGSRGAKPLTRYFPELVTAFTDLLPEPCVLDGEIVVPIGDPGRVRLEWEALSQRIHPAESRITKLAAETPAVFVAFDLLRRGDQDIADLPLADRRAELEDLLAEVPAPIHVTRTTRDVEVARRWLAEFEGAGLDGVVAKPLAAPYQQGRRAMFKIKHRRTADVVVLGYRVHKSGEGVGSLLVGLYGEDGKLYGDAVTAQTDRSRFSSSKDASFVPVAPVRVVEVRYDQMEGHRFRHTVQFQRWRPDRDPESFTYAQLEVPAVYDLANVLD